VEAAVISAFILALCYYWFGIANRHVIFLYEHTTVNIPRAQPFDAETSSRYWMAGLVAAGAVLVLYVGLTFLLGRLAAWRRQTYAPAPWQRVWALCILPLAIGIPAITMTVNEPTLPIGLAAAAAAAALAGLALSLPFGKWAAERPAELAWLTADGLGLMPALLFLRAVELPARGLSVSPTIAWAIALGSVAAGAAWLALMSSFRWWRRRPAPSALALLAAGLALSYVLMPLVHHLLGTPPQYRYITTASNFFAFSPWLQALVLAAAAILALGATTVRRRIDRRPRARN
jgi:hypothetical protein